MISPAVRGRQPPSGTCAPQPANVRSRGRESVELQCRSLTRQACLSDTTPGRPPAGIPEVDGDADRSQDGDRIQGRDAFRGDSGPVLTRTPFLAHSVSNFLNMQVHYCSPRDLDQEVPFGVRFEPRIPSASHCLEHCVAVPRCNPVAKLRPYPGHHPSSKTSDRSGTPARTDRSRTRYKRCPSAYPAEESPK